MINKSNTLVILIIIGFFLIIGFVYLLIYRYQAQKALKSNKKRKFKLPTPQTFILIILLTASLLGNIFSIFNNTNEVPFYQSTSLGNVSSEYKYIEDEVINGLRGEYEVSSTESNDFIMYYATIREELEIENPLLAKYIVYIKYVGPNILEDNLHIKLTNKSKEGFESSTISEYKSTDTILMIRSHEIIDLEIIGEIKSFEWLKNQDSINDDIKEAFENALLLYEFQFEIKESTLQ